MHIFILSMTSPRGQRQCAFAVFVWGLQIWMLSVIFHIFSFPSASTTQYYISIPSQLRVVWRRMFLKKKMGESRGVFSIHLSLSRPPVTQTFRISPSSVSSFAGYLFCFNGAFALLVHPPIIFPYSDKVDVCPMHPQIHLEGMRLVNALVQAESQRASDFAVRMDEKLVHPELEMWEGVVMFTLGNCTLLHIYAACRSGFSG